MLQRRRMANRFSTWAIAKFSRTSITDSQCGFRLYSSRLLRGVTLRAECFDMDSEVIVRAGLAGFKVAMTPVDMGFVGGISTDNSQCLHWKLGDDNQSGTTWVSAGNAYLYTGAGIQFTPNKFTAPEGFDVPSPDLAGVIGVGIANPNFIPHSIDVFYSFLPVSRSTSSTLQPAPTTIG